VHHPPAGRQEQPHAAHVRKAGGRPQLDRPLCHRCASLPGSCAWHGHFSHWRSRLAPPTAGATAMFAKWARDFQKHSNQLPLFDQQLSNNVGGDPNIRYYHSHWALAEDEALVGRREPPALPPACWPSSAAAALDCVSPLSSDLSLPRLSRHRRRPAARGTFKSTTTGWSRSTTATTASTSTR